MNDYISNRTSDATTRRLWYKIGTIHNFERCGKRGALGLRSSLFVAHQLQAGVIFAWASAPIYHLAWQGTFTSWALDPTRVSPVAHAVRDAHFAHFMVHGYTLSDLEPCLGDCRIPDECVSHWPTSLALSLDSAMPSIPHCPGDLLASD